MPKILVADDNSNIQKMVALALKDQGIDVVAVGNGEAAVRKLPDIFPDLVLADVFMPVRNGYEVCEFVKKDPRFAHVPVILLVGAFDPLDEQEAQRVGADGVLKKPFVPPEPLINMVKGALEKSAAEHLVPVTAGATPPAASGYAPQPSGISSAAPFSVPSPAAMDSAAPAGKQAPPPAAPKPEEEPLDRFGMPPSPVALSGDDRPLAFRQLLETETQAEAGKPHPEPPSFQGAGFNVMRFLNETKAGPEADTADAAAGEGHEGPTWGGSGTALPHGDDASLVGQIDWDSEKSHGHASEEAATEPPSAFAGANVEPIAWGKNPLPWADAEEHPAAEAPAVAPPLVPPLEQTPQLSSVSGLHSPDTSAADSPYSSAPLEGLSRKPGAFADKEPAASPYAAEITRKADSHQPAAQEEAALSRPQQGSPTPPPPRSWSDLLGELLPPETSAPREAAKSAPLEPAHSASWEPSAGGGHEPARGFLSAEPEESASASSPIPHEPLEPAWETAARHPLHVEPEPQPVEQEPEASAPEPEIFPSAPPSVAPEQPAVSLVPPAIAAGHDAEVLPSASSLTPSAPAEPKPAKPAAAAPPATGSAQSFTVPPSTDAALIAEVVSRVLERMQPQILDIVTKEILKPVVEALVRRELEKH